MPPDEAIEWQVYVPETYDPEHPAGILTYISPTQKGSIPPQWKTLLDEQNLIWIGANNSGNKVRVQRRMAYALTAPAVINKSYQIDDARVYLAGFSGGGRVASMVAAEYPEIFKGAIFKAARNTGVTTSPIVWTLSDPTVTFSSQGLMIRRSNQQEEPLEASRVPASSIPDSWSFAICPTATQKGATSRKRSSILICLNPNNIRFRSHSECVSGRILKDGTRQPKAVIEGAS
jgi:hypothetical protein